MKDASASIESFLNAAAARQPTPGGGAVAALVGALAVSMGEMVLNYSVAKKDLAVHAEHNMAALRRFSELRDRLTKLLADDQAAFIALTDAKKQGIDPLPLTRICIDVPKKIVECTMWTLEQAVAVAATSNPFLLSDLAVCGECAMAALRSGLHNIAANLSELPAIERADYERDMQSAKADGARLLSQLLQAIEVRQAAI